jgi:DNA-binding transcriptional LysR family regulator
VAKLMDYLAERKYMLTIHEGKTTDVIEDVYSNRSTIGILSVSNLNREFFERYFISKSLVFTPMLLMQQHVFLRKEHPLAHLQSIAIEQLRDFPYLTYHQDDIPLYFAEELIDVNSLTKLVYVKDRGTMNNLLANTNGYNLGTGCIVENYMNPNIIAIPLNEHNEIQIGLVKRYDQLLSEEISVYIDFLRDALNRSAPKDL